MKPILTDFNSTVCEAAIPLLADLFLRHDDCRRDDFSLKTALERCHTFLRRQCECKYIRATWWRHQSDRRGNAASLISPFRPCVHHMSAPLF